MRISVNQINQNELLSFVQQTASGQVLSGNLYYYFEGSGWSGPNVVYTTGGYQLINGEKEFSSSPYLPYSGNTGTAPSTKFVIDYVSTASSNLSGYISGFYISINGNETILGNKIFTGAIQVGSPINTGDAINFLYLSGVSGALQQYIDNYSSSESVNIIEDQLISGEKTFASSPIVPIPTNSSGAVPKSYVDSLQLTGVVYTTGDQTVSGVKTFLDSPIIPIGLNSNAAVTRAQLDAATWNSQNATGYSVTNINGITGAILTQGANGITTYMCNNILYISGNNLSTSLLYTAQIPLTSGATGVSFVWNSGFDSKPVIVHSLEVTGSSSISFLNSNLYGVTTGSFNVAFESAIPNNNYLLNFSAVPISNGSGFAGIRGEQGGLQPTWNARGIWNLGVSYSKYDYVYQFGVGTSYVSLTGHNSDAFNTPVGTGNAYWAIVSSGLQGRQGPVGYFVNSGIITGNFVNLSFFLNPVVTGLDLAESFVMSSFNITGFKLGCVDTGVNPLMGGILSGRFYSRDDEGAKNIITTFTLNTGVRTFYSGGLALPFTGSNRLGVDILNTISGISKLSLGVFGFGT